MELLRPSGRTGRAIGALAHCHMSSYRPSRSGEWNSDGTVPELRPTQLELFSLTLNNYSSKVMILETGYDISVSWEINSPIGYSGHSGRDIDILMFTMRLGGTYATILCCDGPLSSKNSRSASISPADDILWSDRCCDRMRSRRLI